MSGSTGFTSTSGWRTTACARWWLSARAADGTKELVALEDGYRESAESWAELWRGAAAPRARGARGRSRLAMGPWGSGAPSGNVWPQTAEQRDWFHKLGNVLDTLPKRLQPKAKRALHDILAAETREQAEEHLDTFVAEYEVYRHGFLGQPGECIHAAVVSANARRTTAGARKPSRSINHCWL